MIRQKGASFLVKVIKCPSFKGRWVFIKDSEFATPQKQIQPDFTVEFGIGSRKIVTTSVKPSLLLDPIVNHTNNGSAGAQHLSSCSWDDDAIKVPTHVQQLGLDDDNTATLRKIYLTANAICLQQH
jgi:hypothetical protein